MLEMRNGSWRLFQFRGITVWLHWSWLVVAGIFFVLPGTIFSENIFVGIFTYLGLFGIVLIHEFGHALACRSVGGKADTIMLWPLGGIAFVQPPQRPGAVLWSIAAGPLVNVVLLPILFGLYLLAAFLIPTTPEGIPTTILGSNLIEIVYWLNSINLVLLIFNMLPIYPLDGGQILQAILWFFIGRSRSLQITSAIGLVCAIVGGILALMSGRTWLFIIAIFVGWQAYNGYRVSQIMAQQENQYRFDPWNRR
ncbi:Putative zinc metalloprotease Rip3 [Poriferisphaera corsica]|uniref:Zinc metalloprotease Rip3 n=1 Tax=Poriferisphaera corsica TaxID=2528020 RepID=A0A517YV28_9BACT|nr:site-2 protease family protein [Poriferisphaera corsica]QDU34081.1 Putative zinc metalloprotease Rip3 [Poriferisphaera corsica]